MCSRSLLLKSKKIQFPNFLPGFRLSTHFDHFDHFLFRFIFSPIQLDISKIYFLFTSSSAVETIASHFHPNGFPLVFLFFFLFTSLFHQQQKKKENDERG